MSLMEMTLATMRNTHAAGGFTAARVVAAGTRFYITAEARKGAGAVLVASRHLGGNVRMFSDPTTPLRILRDLGFASVTVDLSKWEPAQRALPEKRRKD